MKVKPSRAILAIYSADEGEPAKAWDALRSEGADVCLFRADGSVERSRRAVCEDYAGLRLENEVLLIAQTEPSRVQAIVQTLRGSGEPAIFVIAGSIRQPPDVETGPRAAPRPPADFASQCALRRGSAVAHQEALLSRLRGNGMTLDASRQDLVEAARLDHALTAAAEWLLDNAYLIRIQIAEIGRHLPRDYHKILPAGPSGYPSIYELAEDLVAHTDCSLSKANIQECLTQYQQVAPLTIAELWSFPLLLRMALIEALARLAAQVSRSQKLRETAYLWANRLGAASREDPAVFETMLRRMEAEAVSLEPYFLTSLAEQLQDEEDALAPVRHWIEERLKTPLVEIVRTEHTREAAERLSTANAFGSLRTLSRLDFAEIFEAVSLVDAELRADPSGVYGRSDFATRDNCRRGVERVSRWSGAREIDVARRAVAMAAQDPEVAAAHPLCGNAAYYLLDEGLARLEAETGARVPFRARLIRTLRRRASLVYMGGIVGLTAWLTALSLALAWDAGVRQPAMLAVLGALAMFPLSELAVQIVNALLISLLPPDKLPKLDLKDGIPPEDATLVVVPMMSMSQDVVRREIEKLEVRFLANQEPNLYFSLFSDFADAAEPVEPGDAELLQAARDGIASLNVRYPGGRFLLFHRARVWSETEQRWIGRERKRGKIEDLNAFLSGKGSSEILNVGSLPRPVRYVITLDSDTQLPPGSARRMVETIAHPLNRVDIDPATRTRRRGYTIIQPRVSIALPGATATRFTRMFADTSGTDPYCQTVSDAQQDLFQEGIYHGKAIYDVAAFRAILGDRFPAETLLSHDLIEGVHAGVGLASDIELFENLPLDYIGYSKRQHRWIRGDWQIAPWIFGRVPGPSGSEPNPLSTIGRWRILDNLRRSLAPVASLLLLLFGWLTKAAPGVWSLAVGLAVAIPAVAPLADRVARRLQGAAQSWQGATDELIRAVVMLAFLPHQAWLSANAIALVAYRRSISRRHLLEWQTAESAGMEARNYLDSTLRQMWVISGLSVLLLVVLRVEGAFAPTWLFVALWALSPALIRWLDRPAALHVRTALGSGDLRFLRRLARQTWRYFDDLVGADSNWLPPDNSQLVLRVEIAQRTSPTNIGLWLASALAAWDLGYLSADELLRRVSQTMSALDRLERHEGHFLNWYDTRTLDPLLPRYLSTVDSGNLLASLWVLERGLQDAVGTPVLERSCLRGLADTLSILEEVCGDDPSVEVPLRALRRLLHGRAEGNELIGRLRLAFNLIQQLRDMGRWHDAAGDERSYWVSRLTRELTSWSEVVDRYLRWMETLTHPPDSFIRSLGEDVVKLRRRALLAVPSLATLANGAPTLVDAILGCRATANLRPEVVEWLDQLDAEYQRAKTNASQVVESFRTLAGAAERFASAMRMGFLYDTQRRLFAVGYLIGGTREFTSHYDLLASECRLASLVAIAKGDVPIEHWFALGRPQNVYHGAQALLSWTGTMFEYLMPLLFTRIFSNSMLDNACREAVRRQMEYGEENQVPWGISECAYSALDSNRIYQYRAFGIPSLALKQGVDDDLVVAPYATVLALAIDPAAAAGNLRRLEELGLAGPMGLYESIDYTRQKKRDGERGVVIQAYMAHHQGMSLLALDNLLHGAGMQRRFHGDLRIRAIESLLFERIPVVRPQLEETRTTLPAAVHPAPVEDPAERTWKEDTAFPRVHLEGNGHYSLMVTTSGGGYSRWDGFDVTRWRPDSTLDAWGSFIYIRDLRSDEVWATAQQPVGARQGTASASFSADRAEFNRRVSNIETVLEVTVAAEDDVEVRRLTVNNRSLRTRQLEFTSYAELALAESGADKAHPAFSKMFVETEYPDNCVLIAHRRPRSPEEASIWAAHILVGATEGIQYETDRAQFLGRGCTPQSPAALRRAHSGSVGAVLDPIFSLRCRATIEPHDRAELSFITVVAATREALLGLIAKYRRPESVTRAFEMAWGRAQLDFRYLRIGPSTAHLYQELASHLLYPNPRLRLPADRLARNRMGQAALWAYGISGDLPMLAVTVADARSLPLVRELLLAHTYWRLRGFRADLIILNQESSSYDNPLRQQLLRQIEARSPQEDIDHPGGVFLRDWHAIPEEGRTLILAASSVVLGGGRGPLQQQLAAARETVIPPPSFVAAGGGAEEPSHPLPFLELPYFNGIGGFKADAREYAIYLKPGSATPAPWINVMANSEFGAMVSESGLGCAWSGNSQSNRLTPWHNDPVSDPQSEAIYLRDEESGALWTPTALPIREKDAYRARHGQGYTVFEHNSHAIGQELTVFVPAAADGAGDPVKIYRLRLRNESSHTRRLTVTYFAEWVLGTTREDMQLHVQTARDEASGALLARQSWIGGRAGQTAFVAASPRASSFSADRTQFLGRNGSVAKPAMLERARLDNRCGSGLDPAAALQVPVSIDPGGQTEVIFLLGQADSLEAARTLVSRYQSAAQVDGALAETRGWWDSTLGALQVRTPLLSTDFLLNRWLPYQALSCRFWGRSALYQSSGAFGFRDQLQDSLAFLYAAPELTRAHILLSASRQFPEGDVQHWWHPDTGMGVRTRCSDDLVWLPFVVAHYIEITGDAGILDEEIAFLEGEALKDGEQERLFVPSMSAQKTPLWDHCQRALERASRLGAHDLPLFGSGDWNDGMNLVGAEGRGESVWLGWFLYSVLGSFADLMERHPDRAPTGDWRRRASALAAAIERSCWDGDWYLRGFFDNGAPLGSHENPEAQIDSLPQSWAVISKAADPERSRRAMDSAERLLVDARADLVKLFTPPFDHSEPNPGYIMGYPPGMRENGGQYTHGSLWLAMARARMGDGAAAVRLLQMMNPVELNRNPVDVARYRGEPYVVAADVYSAQGKAGRCGWTWYTGSAGWMYRIWIEEVLGFRLRGDRLTIAPAIPDDWPGFGITFHYRSAIYEIEVVRQEEDAQLELDGKPSGDGWILLADDRITHHVTVRLSPKPAPIPAAGAKEPVDPSANGTQKGNARPVLYRA